MSRLSGARRRAAESFMEEIVDYAGFEPGCDCDWSSAVPSALARVFCPSRIFDDQYIDRLTQSLLRDLLLTRRIDRYVRGQLSRDERRYAGDPAWWYAYTARAWPNCQQEYRSEWQLKEFLSALEEKYSNA